MKPPRYLAELSWTADGQPVSLRFGNIYPSRHTGPAQSRHTFVLQNQLEQRWKILEPRSTFCIAETGFGTGLNFLAAWQLWDRLAPADARLHFVSTERFPFAASDLQRAHRLWPELAPWSQQLLQQYSSPHPGWHHHVFADGRVTLTLLTGDTPEMLGQLDASVDAWFLDGPSPAADPDMWQPALFQQLGRLSRPGATVAAPGNADTVRSGLIAAGFSVEHSADRAGTGILLVGQAKQLPRWSPPWYARPAQPQTDQRQALIIGAGLAGCSTARALAQRGWTVTVIERHADAAQEASGNPQGILYCKLSPHQTPLSRFVETSYTYSLRLLHRLLAQDGICWSACGVLQLAGSDKETARLRALAAQAYPAEFLQWVDAGQASAIAGVEVSSSGLFFPAGGWVSPPALCQALLDHPAIHLQPCTEAVDLQYRGDRWQASDAQGKVICTAPIAIICSAADSQRFTQSSHLPLKRIRGQVTRLPATALSQGLRSVLCGEGYVSPARDGEHFVGASFRFDRTDTAPSEEENTSNLALLANLSPELDAALRSEGALDAAALQARAALRCTSPDYLPLIGPIAQARQFRHDYAVLAKDASKRPDIAASWYPGLYVNVAHGSRGLISCPLSGELIAAFVDDEPLPLPSELVQAVHPSRFLLRELIRSQ